MSNDNGKVQNESTMIRAHAWIRQRNCQRVLFDNELTRRANSLMTLNFNAFSHKIYKVY